MDANIYQFAALRGMQAEREYFVIMCPLKLIPKVFLYDEGQLPAPLRAQRTLNQSRIPEIAGYLVNNPSEYVFSAITASVDGRVEFVPYGSQGHASNVGVLKIPMESDFIINDGQHRRAAIEMALQENPELRDEEIAVVLFIDAGLKRCQQMFADLNKHAVRPTKSLSVLYDHRDDVSSLAVELAETVPIFKDRTEMEKTTISNRSTSLFTLHAIFQATSALLGKKKKDTLTESDALLAQAFWNRMSEVIPEWQQIMDGEVSTAKLRQSYVHSHGVALQAIAEAGAELIKRYPESWQERLEALQSIDWRRENKGLWEGRAIRNGRMSKARDNVILTINLLKMTLELPLSNKQLELEAQLEGEAAV